MVAAINCTIIVKLSAYFMLRKGSRFLADGFPCLLMALKGLYDRFKMIDMQIVITK
jgi:hypothetical protein